MIHHIYDHNYTPWRRKVKQINGAWTYSIDICRHYLPHLDNTIKDEFGEQSIVVSTCAPLSKYPPQDLLDYSGRFGVLVQFLHSYPHNDPLNIIRHTVLKMGRKFDKIIFVVAYKEYANQINAAYKGNKVSAKYLPMRIGALPNVLVNDSPKSRAVWFGNVYKSKKENYAKVQALCKEKGIELITINGGKAYSSRIPQVKSITQQQAWKYCADSSVVFAVGRCALEAYHIGCNVVIVGDKFGGIVNDRADWIKQEETNFNGRVRTGVESWNIPLKNGFIGLSERIHCTSLVSLDKILWE